jgi:predicted CXXCH cytochrome family protein
MTQKMVAATFFVTMAAAFPAWGQTPGVGTDLAQVERCLGCHGGLRAAWERASSHSLLLDCGTCHAVTAPSGKGHADRPACGRCHSEKSHPTDATACGACHDAHGSANAFLVRESVDLPGGGTAAIRLTKPQGASKDGLVRAGVAGATAGTGLCEVCHQGTAHYDRAGKAAAHDGGWCAPCHGHAEGFHREPATPR